MIKQQIENIIKKNLPEKKEMTVILTTTGRDLPTEYKVPNTEWNDCLDQINTSLIADEVLKVVVETLENTDWIYEEIGETYVKRIINLLTK